MIHRYPPLPIIIYHQQWLSTMIPQILSLSTMNQSISIVNHYGSLMNTHHYPSCLIIVNHESSTTSLVRLMTITIHQWISYHHWPLDSMIIWWWIVIIHGHWSSMTTQWPISYHSLAIEYSSTIRRRLCAQVYKRRWAMRRTGGTVSSNGWGGSKWMIISWVEMDSLNQ